jgi:hypothetical protein
MTCVSADNKIRRYSGKPAVKKPFEGVSLDKRKYENESRLGRYRLFHWFSFRSLFKDAFSIKIA